MHNISDQQLKLFCTLFRGRADVYAKRWEKDGKSGYSLAYEVDWDGFNAFKRTGGSFKNFQGKKPLPLTERVVQSHLFGQQCVGVYPILPDNTSYFIAADFDGPSWLADAQVVVAECQRAGLSVYLEKSRSGNGGHVWVFFAEAYPCTKSRRILLELVRRALKLSEFDKEVSFDRLFPNQDYIEPNGFGNLIALPFQGVSVRRGNTIFIDPYTGYAYEDQWEFLQSVHPHTVEELDAVGSKIFQHAVPTTNPKAGSLAVTLHSSIILTKTELNSELIHFLRENLNFISTEYLTKKKLGMSLYKTQKFFKLIEETDSQILLPRGFLKQLETFLKDKHIQFTLYDERPKYTSVDFTNNIQLLPVQIPIVASCMRNESGVIVAPAGSGKTIIGLELIARRKLPALILVHRKQLLDQWVERIQTFLGIPKKDIGLYFSAKKQTGNHVTIAMMQTLTRIGNLKELSEQFGTIIVDECHHIPAATFREIVSGFNPRYIYGLTATPKRKHNDESLIYAYIGDIIARMESLPELPATEAPPTGSGKTEVIIRKTNITLPFKFTTDNYQLLAKIVCFDTQRNRQLVDDITEQVQNGKKILLLSERRDHLEVLRLYLKGVCEAIVISGEDSPVQRKSKLKQIEAGHYQIILSTGQFFGEGLDIPSIDCLVLAFPFSFEGKLTQYMGRLRGRDNHKVVIDYRDIHIAFLERQFKQRLRVYKKLVNAVIQNAN